MLRKISNFTPKLLYKNGKFAAHRANRAGLFRYLNSRLVKGNNVKKQQQRQQRSIPINGSNHSSTSEAEYGRPAVALNGVSVALLIRCKYVLGNEVELSMRRKVVSLTAQGDLRRIPSSSSLLGPLDTTNRARSLKQSRLTKQTPFNKVRSISEKFPYLSLIWPASRSHLFV